jgi:hypothetical protein
MKRKVYILIFLSMIIIPPAMTQSTPIKIRHTVVFSLNHDKGSAQERDFFIALDQLSAIPGVKNFKYWNEISKKNSFDYLLTMDFSSQHEYDKYNQHPDHIAFVQNIWLKEVKDFMEIDYEITD